MSDRQDLETPGEILAAARKRLSLTVEQVAEKTKIPPAMIEAVESDEYFKISGPIYVRSFLRTIAQAVNVDPENVLALHSRLAGNQSTMQPGETPVWETEEVIVQRVGFTFRPWLVFGGVGLVVVILGFLMIRGCGDKEPSSFVAHGAGQLSGGKAAPQTPREALTDSSTRSAATTEGENISVDTVASLPCFPPGGSVTLAGGKPTDLVLGVRSDHVVSIEVRADRQRNFRDADWGGADAGIADLSPGQLVPGQVYRCQDGFVVFWRADDHFGLKLGDLKGVAAQLQGRPYPLTGLSPAQEIILDRHSVSE